MNEKFFCNNVGGEVFLYNIGMPKIGIRTPTHGIHLQTVIFERSHYTKS